MPHAELEHPWDVTPRQAIAIQTDLRKQLRIVNELPPVARIAGVDVGFEEAGAITRAAVVVLDAETLQPIDQALARRATSMPYIPGLLSFREIPAVLDALAGLQHAPDLLMCDGQGIAHPRRMGIACHLGLLTDIPSIGVAKSRLTGTHTDVPAQRGGWTPLRDADDVIGAALRSRVNVKPIFVSPGHRVDLATALHWTMRCLTRYRLPETTRAADKLASRKN